MIECKRTVYQSTVFRKTFYIILLFVFVSGVSVSLNKNFFSFFTGHGSVITETVCCQVIESVEGYRIKYFAFFPGDKCPEESFNPLNTNIKRSYIQAPDADYCRYFRKPPVISELGGVDGSPCCKYTTKKNSCKGFKAIADNVATGLYTSKTGSCFSENSIGASGEHYGGCFYITDSVDCRVLEAYECQEEVLGDINTLTVIRYYNSEKEAQNSKNFLLGMLLKSVNDNNCFLVYGKCRVDGITDVSTLEKIPELYMFSVAKYDGGKYSATAAVDYSCNGDDPFKYYDYDCDGITDALDDDPDGDGVPGGNINGNGCHYCDCKYISRSFPHLSVGGEISYSLQIGVCVSENENSQDNKCDVSECMNIIENRFEKPTVVVGEGTISLREAKEKGPVYKGQSQSLEFEYGVSNAGNIFYGVNSQIDRLEGYFYQGKTLEGSTLKIDKLNHETVRLNIDSRKSDYITDSQAIADNWEITSCPKADSTNIYEYYGVLLAYKDSVFKFYQQLYLHLRVLVEILEQQSEMCKDAIENFHKKDYVKSCGMNDITREMIINSDMESLKTICYNTAKNICERDNIGQCLPEHDYNKFSEARKCPMCIEVPCVAGDALIAGKEIAKDSKYYYRESGGTKLSGWNYDEKTGSGDVIGSCEKKYINPPEGVCGGGN